jgi:hypothetical protein
LDVDIEALELELALGSTKCNSLVGLDFRIGNHLQCRRGSPSTCAPSPSIQSRDPKYWAELEMSAHPHEQRSPSFFGASGTSQVGSPLFSGAGSASQAGLAAARARRAPFLLLRIRRHKARGRAAPRARRAGGGASQGTTRGERWPEPGGRVVARARERREASDSPSLVGEWWRGSSPCPAQRPFLPIIEQHPFLHMVELFPSSPCPDRCPLPPIVELFSSSLCPTARRPSFPWSSSSHRRWLGPFFPIIELIA